MSFFIYDMAFLIVFSLAVFIFLYRNRKNLKREGITYLYRTSIGLKIIDSISKKYPRFLRILGYIIIIMGYILMIAMLYLLGKTLAIFFQSPDFVRFVKIPPLAPLVPYLPQLFHADYLPMFYFTYWIVVISIVGIVHEFSHGLFARLYNIKVKSTGFAFIGPFIGAFVEPDEKQMKKAEKKEQLAILAAGTFSNAVLTIFFFVLLWLFFISMYSASGIIFNSYTYNLIDKSSINFTGNNISIDFNGGLNLAEIKSGNKTYFITQEIASQLASTESSLVFAYEDAPALRAGLNGIIIGIDDKKINQASDLREYLTLYKPGDKVKITTFNTETKEKKDFEVVLGENPINQSMPYMGIATLQLQTSVLGKIRNILMFFKDPGVYYTPKFSPDFIEFIYYLLWWLAFINLSVALANMLPAWIFDGGRFFYISVLAIVRDEKIAKNILKIMNYIILAIFLLLMILWAYSFLQK